MLPIRSLPPAEPSILVEEAPKRLSRDDTDLTAAIGNGLVTRSELLLDLCKFVP